MNYKPTVIQHSCPSRQPLDTLPRPLCLSRFVVQIAVRYGVLRIKGTEMSDKSAKLPLMLLTAIVYYFMSKSKQIASNAEDRGMGDILLNSLA